MLGVLLAAAASVPKLLPHQTPDWQHNLIVQLDAAEHSWAQLGTPDLL